jgi:hypothetical protein
MNGYIKLSLINGHVYILVAYTTGMRMKIPNIRFHENLFRSSVVISCLQILCSVVDVPKMCTLLIILLMSIECFVMLTGILEQALTGSGELCLPE